MKKIIFCLIIFLAIHICLILKSIFVLKDIHFCLNILFQYCNSASLHGYGILTKSTSYDASLNMVLRNYPLISKYTSLYSPSLSYGATDLDNYSHAVSLYHELQMTQNWRFEELKQSLNPINTLKYLFSVPSKFLKFLGIKPPVSSLNLINIIGWLTAYLLNIYSADVKSLLDSIFQNFINT